MPIVVAMSTQTIATGSGSIVAPLGAVGPAAVDDSRERRPDDLHDADQVDDADAARHAVERRRRHREHREDEEQHDRGQSAGQRHALARAHKPSMVPSRRVRTQAGLPDVSRS